MKDWPSYVTLLIVLLVGKCTCFLDFYPFLYFDFLLRPLSLLCWYMWLIGWTGGPICTGIDLIMLRIIIVTADYTEYELSQYVVRSVHCR